VTHRSRRRESKSVTQAAGALLTGPGLAALAAVLVLAAWHSQTGILLLAGLFLATAACAWLWSRLALAGVRAERRLETTRAFAGERIGCVLRLVNRKPLPLPWVRLEDSLPPALRPVPAGEPAEAGSVTRSAALLWYRGIRWKLEIDCARRGFYPLGPLKITTADLLGLYARSAFVGETAPIIVYPRIFPVDTGRIPSLHPMGESRAALRLFQDPTHTIGVRGYDCGDSLRLIHWKATARRADLQVRVLAATTSFQAGIFLDAASFTAAAAGMGPDKGAGTDEEFELGISVAASIAAALAERGSPTGLFVNARLADSGQPAAIAPSAGKGRLVDILEALAKVTAVPTGPLTPFVESQRAKLPAGTTLVFIVARPPESLASLAAGLHASGFRVLVLTVGAHPAPQLPARVPWQRVARPGDLGPAGGGAA
jgi:uncharacterized protein (DUF58 family)